MKAGQLFALLVIGFISPGLGAEGSGSSELERHLTLNFPDEVELTFEVSPFEADQHQVRWCTYKGWKHVCTIDGRPYFGSDGQIPYTTLDSLVLQYGSHTVHLDVSCMFNPWVGAANRSLYNVRKFTNEYYVVNAAFSDGAGAYVAEWRVQGSGSVRTHLREAFEDEP